MTTPAKTGSVTSKGKIRATGKIVTGIEIEGAAGDAVLAGALQLMGRLRTGDVSGERGVTAQEIVTGLRYVNPDAPQTEAFLAELKSLHEMLTDLQKRPAAPAEVAAAGRDVDDALAEAQKQAPQGNIVVKRLRSAVEFITDAGKLWEAADKAGALVAKALPTAVALYQVAQKLFA